MGGLFSSSTTTATTTHSPPTEKKNEILLIGEGILIDSAMTAFAYNLEWIRRKNKKKKRGKVSGRSSHSRYTKLLLVFNKHMLRYY